jgi:hypothetical protein
MSYFPILKAPYCHGQTILYNFPPNNWEKTFKLDQFIHLTYIKDTKWQSILLGKLRYKAFKKIGSEDIIGLIPEGSLGLLSLSRDPLPEKSDELPVLNCNHTIVPEYRSTLGLKSSFSHTSYQGELNPFPPKASLLSFSPFLQFGNDIENYLMLLNLEKHPKNRVCQLELYESRTNVLMKKHQILSNNINVVSLDDAGFDEDSLPIATCNGMTAIPLYFSTYKKGRLLSLEHTHPPASFVVHGNRFGAQKFLKNEWLSRLNNVQ